MSRGPSIDAFLARMQGASASAVVPVVRQYLGDVRTFLRELHNSGAGGAVVNETHSDLIDRLVRRLFEFAEEAYFAGGAEADTDLCVVAVGGYARREMSLHSDVDLLFLYRESLTPYVASVAERVQQWLWDSALTVGGATRTIADTVSLAREDSTVQTAVLAPRFLVGSGVLFHEFSEALRVKVFADPARFIEDQLRGLAERHTRFGDSLYLLQPNLKDGAGGLRDYQVSYWAMQSTQTSARGREDFLHLGLLKEEELAEYEAALDFLWRVRNQLHLLSGRKNDQMSFELQEQIAAALGFGESDEADAELPVELFMSAYYRHARVVQSCSSLVIEQCQARLRGKPRRRKLREVEDGFRVADGQLEIPHSRMLREHPLRLLGAFAVAQLHDVTLTRKARRLVRENLDLIDDAFRASPEASAIFLKILGAERRVMRSLMAMNEVGLLAAYLPEWAHIVCRWQHVMYHTYTVDVHSIFLVEELRRLWQGKYQPAVPELTELMRGCDDRVALFLGCLLHDIGKGFGGDHSDKGAVRARRCALRLGLSPERVERVVFLVQHHLLMSHLAQSRDLSDPKMILEFARVAQDRWQLRDLYLLTFADIRASSKKAWTDWKGQLLRDLFERTSEFLETGSDDPNTALELIDERVEARRQAAGAELQSLGVAESKVRDYFESMPRRYFIAHAPREIARHARVVLAYSKDRVMSIAVRETPDGSSEFILCTRDVHGLYANVAGVLTAHGINILGANVYTARSGVALEIYRLTTPAGGDEERRLLWAKLERALTDVLSGQQRVADLLRLRPRPVGPDRLSSRKPARVAVSNDESDFYTIVDITANDRLGLLHDLTRTIADHGSEIYISKAATVLDQVTDTFYLKDAQGKKLSDAEEIERLRAGLLAAAERGEGGLVGS
ncbi:MAG: [protein-PII] uridylyltransferase [Candidatus Limnocylindria bacterium]